MLVRIRALSDDRAESMAPPKKCKLPGEGGSSIESMRRTNRVLKTRDTDAPMKIGVLGAQYLRRRRHPQYRCRSLHCTFSKAHHPATACKAVPLRLANADRGRTARQHRQRGQLPVEVRVARRKRRTNLFQQPLAFTFEIALLGARCNRAGCASLC